ncbi:MAG: hypothetical protein ACRERX_05515 [Pseudomonas sp.]
MSRNGIEHRAAKVSLVTGLSTLTSIGFQLVSVPICLKYWGKETYGSWLALYAAFMLIRSLDAGLVSYVGNKLNYLYHQDQTELRHHLASATAGVAIIAVLQLVIGLLATLVEVTATGLGVSAADHQSRLALLVLVCTWALSGPYLGIVHRLLIPAGFMYQAAWWGMGFQVSQFVAIILAAMLRFNMIQTSLLFAFVQASIYLASAIYIRQKLPDFYPWWRGVRPRVALKDLGSSMALAASNLIQQGLTNGTVMLVSILSGPAAVPIFTTARTLANLWTNVTNVLSTPLVPDVVRYHATSQGGKLISISQAYWVLVGSIVNLGVLITFPLIESMYGYWTAHAVVFDKTLLCLLLAAVVIANAGGLMTLYFNGINSLRVVLIAAAGKGVLSVVMGTVLFFSSGLAGFGAGVLGGELFALLMQARYFLGGKLLRHRVGWTVTSLLPVTISIASVLMFLVGEGLQLSFSHYLYQAALVGVVISAMWGWHRLEHDVKTRLMRMVSDQFVSKDIA